MQDITELLDSIKFPKNYSRKNIMTGKPLECFCLGEVNYRGQKFLNYKTRGPSKHNEKFPELLQKLTELINNYDPDFKFTTIQLNKNIQSPRHIDKNNVGYSYIIGLGDYNGGELNIENLGDFNIKNSFLKFNGTNPHWTSAFQGTRYSIIFFTHTFKPPRRDKKNIFDSSEIVR